MRTSTYAIEHVRAETATDFTEVEKNFERQLGTYDATAITGSRPPSAEEAKARIEAMAGSSGFMLFGATDHGGLLSLFGERKRAKQYVIGNPLVALQMTQHCLAAALYVPVRVLLYEDEHGGTRIEYDRPSSLLAQFKDERLASVALMLDGKLERLVGHAVGQG